MKTQITAVLIEDEKPGRDLIKIYLKKHPAIQLIAECSNGFEGVKSINKHRPELIFLDIQMPKLTGFEMLELIDYRPQIIFTTAYDEYAIKAFELNSIDYLLKPFSQARFDAAIEKLFFQKTESAEAKVELELPIPEKLINRVVIKIGNKIQIIPISEINFIEAQDDYVMLYTKQGKFLKQKTMKYFENSLNKKQFIRIHRSYIVNVAAIDRLELMEKDSYVLHTKADIKLRISKSGLKKIKQILDF